MRQTLPSKRNDCRTVPSDRVLYRLGKRAGRLINHWKRFRHLATRDAQQADNDRSLWLVAVILL
jgi:hypothetical protein